MDTELKSAAAGGERAWTRISSFKPQLAAMLIIAMVAFVAGALAGRESNAVPIITGGILIAIGFLALTSKVVHRRGNEHRISTLLYSEVVTVDDICMTVTNPGPFWTRCRIHLRRPARFGWRVSFVPTEALLRQRNMRTSSRA
jgi:hypothetical protein